MPSVEPLSTTTTSDPVAERRQQPLQPTGAVPARHDHGRAHAAARSAWTTSEPPRPGDHRGRLEQRAGDRSRDDRRRAHDEVARRDAGEVALERAERDVLLAREAVEERLGRAEQILVEDDVADARHRRGRSVRSG